MTDNTELDRLFAEARAAMRAEVKVRKARVPTEREVSAEERLRAELAPLENWTPRRSIALVHQETVTLLGTFTEYVHDKAPGARRLVRDFEAPAPSVTEYVLGQWDLRIPEQPPTRHHIWHQTIPVLMNCVLGRMHMSGEMVSLSAVFGEGRLDRVELREPAVFTSPRQPECLILPVGTDILPEMSRSSIDNLMKIVYDN
jgi:hypothetical protein